MRRIKYLIQLLVILLVFSTVGVEHFFAEGEIWTYDYTGQTEVFTAPLTGKYHVELFGASGGGAHIISSFDDTQSMTQGGFGGYTEGYLNLYAGDILYITVGQSGTINGSATFNGGGAGGNGTGAGGGATHVATVSGLLSSLASNKEAVIAVAGGGGGIYSQSHRHNAIGSGGAILGGANPSAGMASQSFGYQFGQGQNHSSGQGGAGGGGWFGGYAATMVIHGGAGGSGYMDGLYDASTDYSRHTGNGQVIITFIGEVNTTLELQLGNHISYNGKRGNVIIEGNYGDTVDINNFVVDPGYTFHEWIRVSGDFDPATDGHIYTFGTEDAKIKAKYSAPLSITTDMSEMVTENRVKIMWEQDDPYSKEVNLYQSTDGINWNLAASSDDSYIDQYSKYYNTPGIYTYEVKIGAIYKLTADGAKGGTSAKQGGKGARVEANALLTPGTTLYLVVGGAGSSGGSGGYNGGGNGYSNGTGTSGSGGGASHIATANGVLSSFGNASNASKYVLIAAGGGGGGSGQGSRGSGSVGGGNGGNGGQTGSSGGNGNTSGDGTSNLLAGYGGGGASQTGGGGGGGTGHNHSNGADHTYNRGCGGGGGGGWYGGGGGGSGWMDHESGDGEGYSGSSGSFGKGGNGGHGNPMVDYAWHTGAGGGGGGGSSYANPNLTTNPSYTSGVNNGNGYVGIAIDASQTLLGANTFATYALDTMAPNIPTTLEINAGEVNDVRLDWDDVDDNGVVYYYQVKSYVDGNLDKTSEIVSAPATSGVKGYYYYLDNNETGTATTVNQFTYDSHIEVSGATAVNNKYLHVAAIDYAGNLAETKNFKIDMPIPKIILTYYKANVLYVETINGKYIETSVNNAKRLENPYILKMETYDTPTNEGGLVLGITDFYYEYSTDGGVTWSPKTSIYHGEARFDHIIQEIDAPTTQQVYYIKITASNAVANKAILQDIYILGNGPAIKANSNYYFINGEVTVEDLKINAHAYDLVDGDLTSSIVIKYLTYQNGVTDDNVQGNEWRLDTSKVQTIYVTYSVTNSQGKTSEYMAPVYIIEKESYVSNMDGFSIYNRYIDDDFIESLPNNSIWKSDDIYATDLEIAINQERDPIAHVVIEDDD